MLESHPFFSKMVDELVEFSEYDPELAAGIKWLDGEAQRKGITFYDAVFEVLYQHDVNEKASEWFRGRKLMGDTICGWCGMPKKKHTEYGWSVCQSKRRSANSSGYQGGGIG